MAWRKLLEYLSNLLWHRYNVTHQGTTISQPHNPQGCQKGAGGNAMLLVAYVSATGIKAARSKE